MKVKNISEIYSNRYLLLLKKTPMELGTLEIVDLRTVWNHEALSFTRWLAKEENIQMLAEELSISIEDVKIEHATGRFNADIFAVESTTKQKIIIENQLENIDHKHLGQIITYASGLDANIIIWVAKGYNDEHKAAIDWLNRNIRTQVRFFLIQVQLYKIGNSLPAPKFDIISQPNDWVKIIQDSSTGDDTRMTETRVIQLQYWEGFRNFMTSTESKTYLNLGRTPKPRPYYEIMFGTSEAYIALGIFLKNNSISCELFIRNRKDIFDRIAEDKLAIESQLGSDLQWVHDDRRLSFQIFKEHSVDLLGTSDFNAAYKWMKHYAEAFERQFSPYFKTSEDSKRLS